MAGGRAEQLGGVEKSGTPVASSSQHSHPREVRDFDLTEVDKLLMAEFDEIYAQLFAEKGPEPVVEGVLEESEVREVVDRRRIRGDDQEHEDYEVVRENGEREWRTIHQMKNCLRQVEAYFRALEENQERAMADPRSESMRRLLTGDPNEAIGANMIQPQNLATFMERFKVLKIQRRVHYDEGEFLLTYARQLNDPEKERLKVVVPFEEFVEQYKEIFDRLGCNNPIYDEDEEEDGEMECHSLSPSL